MRTLLADIDTGTAASVAFVLPPHAFWAPLLYDLALLTGDYVRARGLARRLSLVTPERAPLEMFGPRASLAIGQRLRREGIELVLDAAPDAVAADRIVTLPALSGPAVDGLRSDSHGFLPTDELSRVRGADDVYAAGVARGAIALAVPERPRRRRLPGAGGGPAGIDSRARRGGGVKLPARVRDPGAHPDG
jgi:sulfide:quinone oxidoreductase